MQYSLHPSSHLRCSHNSRHHTKFKLRAHEECPVRKVAQPMFARVACEDYAETFLSCFTNLGNVNIFLVPGLGTQISYFYIWKDISNIDSCVFKHQCQIFHQMSPSEFIYFSLCVWLQSHLICGHQLALRCLLCQLQTPRVAQAKPSFTGPRALSWPDGAMMETLIMSAARELTPQSRPWPCSHLCPSIRPTASTPCWT